MDPLMHPSVTVDPFPHVVMNGLWDSTLLRTARSEFDLVPDGAWQVFDNDHERKRGVPFSGGGAACRLVGERLASPEWCKLLSDLFGVPDLMFDDLGGGLHDIRPGGFLDVHVDFNRHPNGRYRRINCLVYLNDDPDPSGNLELRAGPWDESHESVSIPAKLNSTVAFLTSETSWHGHPIPLAGAASRRSLAAYYYTETPPDGDLAEPHSTIFPGPG